MSDWMFGLLCISLELSIIFYIFAWSDKILNWFFYVKLSMYIICAYTVWICNFCNTHHRIWYTPPNCEAGETRCIEINPIWF